MLSIKPEDMNILEEHRLWLLANSSEAAEPKPVEESNGPAPGPPNEKEDGKNAATIS